MRLFDRFLLFLYSLAVGILSLLLLGQVFGFTYLDRLFLDYSYPLVIGAFVLFLISLRFIFFRTGGNQEPQAITQKTEHGEIRIALQTLESLTERATRQVRGIKDLKTKVRQTETGLRIAVRISVEPDLDIPQISSNVQQKVKDYVEATTGITVANVVVHVMDIAKAQAGKSAARPRVE